MNVKNVIKYASRFLDMTELNNYLESNNGTITNDIQNQINDFILAFNMVYTDIACNYIDFVGKVNVRVDNQQINYASITNTNSIIDIIDVKDSLENSINYKTLATSVYVIGNYDNVEVTYSYIPSKVTTINDNFTLSARVDELTIAIGVVGAYLFLKGDFDEGFAWDKRFKQSMFSLIRPRKNLHIPARRWY